MLDVGIVYQTRECLDNVGTIGGSGVVVCGLRLLRSKEALYSMLWYAEVLNEKPLHQQSIIDTTLQRIRWVLVDTDEDSPTLRGVSVVYLV